MAARGGGQICRPFVVCDVMLPKKRTDGIRLGIDRPRHKIGVIPTKSNRTQQRPNVIAQDTEDRYALQL